MRLKLNRFKWNRKKKEVQNKAPERVVTVLTDDQRNEAMAQINNMLSDYMRKSYTANYLTSLPGSQLHELILAYMEGVRNVLNKNLARIGNHAGVVSDEQETSLKKVTFSDCYTARFGAHSIDAHKQDLLKHSFMSGMSAITMHFREMPMDERIPMVMVYSDAACVLTKSAIEASEAFYVANASAYGERADT